MSDLQRITVTLHWHNAGSAHEAQIAFVDQTPHQLIPTLVDRLELPRVDHAGEPIAYEVRLGSEQRPPLLPRELLSSQGVRFGSDLCLVPRVTRYDLPRCILQLPDGSSIVIPPHGQALTRSWLMAFMQLHNPEAYLRELERLEQNRSAFRLVSNRPHCTVAVAQKNDWIVTTDRTDVWTEYATGQDFDRIPVGTPIRLDNGMRLRLGGDQGVEIGITLV